MMWNLRLVMALVCFMALCFVGCGSSDECLDLEAYDTCSGHSYFKAEQVCAEADYGLIPQSECDLEIKYADDVAARCEARHCRGEEL